MIEQVFAFGLMLVCLAGWFATHVCLERAHRALHAANVRGDVQTAAAVKARGERDFAFGHADYLAGELRTMSRSIERMTTRSRGADGRFAIRAGN